jgi:signal transduction histidine kinase|uniref:histidine kinase n=1 Tax=Desulfobacca acetoxidans TaxID=60893 RepID=A0A7C5EPS0_9BACT
MDPEEALQQIRRSLHELAQPLAAVMGLLDLLLLEQEDNPSIYQDIQMINERLQKVLEIIAQIREIARSAT